MGQRVVIIGAGIGGVPAAYVIKTRMGSVVDVCVVSAGPDFQFTPSNPWVALGWRDASDIAFPIEPYLIERGITFIPVAAQRIEPAGHRVILMDGRAVDYDFLIIATGPEPAFDEIPGLGPQTHTFSVIRTPRAVEAYAAYRQFVTRPGPIVVGAAQHSAILGPVYEMAFLIDADLRRRHVRRRAPITIISPEPYPGHLGLGGQGESRRLLEGALKENHITFIGNAVTERVEAGQLHLAQYDNAGNRVKLPGVDFAYSIYWPPFRGVAALRHSRELADERGFVVVDDYLRSRHYRNVFALGVCVSRPAVVSTPVPIGAPESVYSIQNEVETVATNVAATIKGEPLTSGTPRRAHWISDLGENGAQYLSSPHVPLQNINWLRQGTWVHLAKTEFEKHFINKIKLGMVERGNASTHLATVVSALESRRVQGQEHKPLSSGGVQRLSIALETESAYELAALAKVLRCDARELAAVLLKAAVQDAESYIAPGLREELEQARREALVANLPETKPGVHFQGGSP